jgi:hypothetical protein
MLESTSCVHAVSSPRPDNQPDLYSRSPALSPAVPVAPTTLRMIHSVAALAELDDAGLARLITAALKEGQRLLYPSFGTGAVIDSALVRGHQAPASAQAAQGLSVEELAPAQISLARTALAAGVSPAWIAREFDVRLGRNHHGGVIFLL